MIWRNLLLRAYPGSWRREYGEEFVAILAKKQMTFGLVADVVSHGARQHVYRDEPWKICAVGMSVWTLLLMLVATGGLVSRPSFLVCYFGGQLFVSGAGAWTFLREKSGVWKATAASAKAALLPNGMLVLLTIFNLLRYWARYGQSASHWIWKNLWTTALLSLVFGFAGAMLGRFFGRFASERGV